MSAFLEMAMVPPGQVTEISFSPGLQARSQLPLWPQPGWRSACRPLEPAAPGGPEGPIGPVSPLTPCGPCGPASPCGPAGPCGPSKQPASINAAIRATIVSDARTEVPLKIILKRNRFTAAWRSQSAARFDTIAGAILSGAAFAVFHRRRVSRRHKTWIDVAKTAIAGDHMRRAFLDTAEFAIPHHVAGAEILHRAPWRIAEAAGVARGSAKADRCRNSKGRQCRSEADCHGAKSKPPRWRCKAPRGWIATRR